MAKLDADTEQPVIFHSYSLGVGSNRDDVVYSNTENDLKSTVTEFIERYNSEVDRYKREGDSQNIDEFVSYGMIKWSSSLKDSLKRHIYAIYQDSKIKVALYRPYSKKFLFFDSVLNQRLFLMRHYFPAPNVNNIILCLTSVASEKPFMCIASDRITDLHLAGAGAGTQCFPLLVYDQDGKNYQENITNWALERFRTHYIDSGIDKNHVFYYIYAIFHEPLYRELYAENLKLELPRIPFRDDFHAYSDIGRRLADLHVGYEQADPWPLEWVYAEGVPLSYRVEKMRLSPDKSTLVVNDSLTLAGIPPEVAEYRLGNRSALEWVIDQHQVKVDKRSGTRSDPNRDDDPEAIVRLVGQVVRVSVETVRLVASLAALAPTPEPADAG